LGEKGFEWQKMEFFVAQNTSRYLLSQIKSAIIGGLLRQTERLPVGIYFQLQN
jgi:hypothetical protein